MNKIYNNKGYTLLFAALTAALVLGVAVFILSVSRKQFILASTARDSTFSIYAADSGIECAALRNGNYDGSGNPISSSTMSNLQFNCGGHTYIMTDTSAQSHTAFSQVYKQVEEYIDTGGGTCARLVITSGLDLAANGSEPKKVYDSSGYNICTGEGINIVPNFDSPRTVERALRLTYKGDS